MVDRVFQPATLCYLHREGRTLMLHRVKKKNDVHEGKWNGLGGKFMPGETPEACVAREVREESGLSLERPRWRGVITFPQFTPGVDWLVFVFTADRFSGNLIESAEGRLAWIPDDKIMDLNLWDGDRIFLPWLKRGAFFSGYFRYEAGRLVESSVEAYGAG